MSNSGFAPGDIVMLKSGGPRMTVVDVGTYGGEPKVKCQWFAGDKFDALREDVFIEEVLKKYS